MEKVTDKTIVFNASVVSRKGISSLDNTNNFYINGRYMYEHESEAVQVTIEKRSNEGLFAICNGMNNIEHKDNHIVSVIKELDKYSRKVSGFKVDIRSKLEMLGERVQEVHNLVHSMTLDDESYAEGNNAAFSGLVLSEGKAAAINIGDSAAFLFRNGSLRQLTTDYSKPQRLLKMGIIPKEMAPRDPDPVTANEGFAACGRGRDRGEDEVDEVVDIDGVANPIS
jgi:protein phosphatase